MRQQFDLSLWLQDKSRKVVTRDGRPVRIVCWDRKYDHNDFPIIALEDWDNGEFVNFVSSNGKVDLSGSENIHDLFFAEEEEGLTEFESKLADLLVWNHPRDIETASNIAKRKSKQLLDLAREEILKDLPKWKKLSKSVCFDRTNSGYFAFIGNDTSKPAICCNGYYILLACLETLPKEE